MCMELFFSHELVKNEVVCAADSFLSIMFCAVLRSLVHNPCFRSCVLSSPAHHSSLTCRLRSISLYNLFLCALLLDLIHIAFREISNGKQTNFFVKAKWISLLIIIPVQVFIFRNSLLSAGEHKQTVLFICYFLVI